MKGPVYYWHTVLFFIHNIVSYLDKTAIYAYTQNLHSVGQAQKKLAVTICRMYIYMQVDMVKLYPVMEKLSLTTVSYQCGIKN